MCTCGQNYASLWAVSPANSSGCGCISSNSSVATTATRCGYAASSNNGCATASSGCFGRCSSCGGYNAYSGQTSNSFVVSRVSGCRNCPYARCCGCCQCCGCTW